MASEIGIKNETGWQYTQQASFELWYKSIALNDLLNASAHFSRITTAYDFKQLLQQLSGNFGLILRKNKQIFFAVDRIKSSTILYSQIGNNFYLDCRGERLEKILLKTNNAELDNLGLLTLATAGYASKQRTCYKAISQLLAGQFGYYDDNTRQLVIKSYYVYQPWHIISHSFNYYKKKTAKPAIGNH